MHAKRLGEYLDMDDRTSRLVPQATRLLNIRQRLAEALPDTLWRSWRIGNYKQGVVVVFAGNNAAAAKIRLWAPRMTEILSALGYQVTKIKVEVQAMRTITPEPGVKKALSLSPRAAAALARSGRKLSDGRLKRAVAALSKRKH
jgi:hypothetical protein